MPEINDQYERLLQDVLVGGEPRRDRTGVGVNRSTTTACKTSMPPRATGTEVFFGHPSLFDEDGGETQ